MIESKDLLNIIKIPKEFKNNLNNRPDWDNFFMGIAYLISTRSSCLDRKVGAVIVNDKTIIATGFNGAPRGISDCLERNECVRKNRDKSLGKDYDNCYAAHAEVNALANLARMGSSLMKGSVLYTVVYPCTGCARLIINSGIEKVFYAEGFPNDTGLATKLLKEAGIMLEKVDKGKIANVLYKALDHMIMRDEEGKPIS